MDAKKRKELEEAHKKAQLAEANRIANYRANLAWLLAHPQGRAFIWDALKRSNLFDREFLSDPGKLQFRNGQQGFGVQLYVEIMNTNPDAYAKMWAENKEGDK